jgi:hypothetical protein
MDYSINLVISILIYFITNLCKWIYNRCHISTLKFMDNIGNESLAVEFKEFIPKYETLLFSTLCRKEISFLLYHNLQNPIYKINKYEFNSSINLQLEEMLEKYIPIYCSAFTKSISSNIIKTGNLHIGVTDNGDITGIPFIGNIKSSDIRKILHDIIDKNILKYANKSTIDLHDYIDNIDIIIDKLDINKIELNMMIKIELIRIKQRISSNKKQKLEYIKYLQSICCLYRYIKKYSCPLWHYVDHLILKQETILYIHKHFNTDLAVLQSINYEDIEKYKLEVIKEFEDNEKINNFIKLYDNPGPVLNEVIGKACMNPFTFVYWIMHYKDYMTTSKKNHSNKDKPKKYNKQRKNYPIPILFRNYLMNESNINAILLKMFPEINLFKITLKFNKCKDNNYVQIFSFKSDKWETRIRGNSRNGPQNEIYK